MHVLLRRLGFSLTELMIVVAIIGVLAVIGTPIYRRVIQKSRQVEAKAILGAIYPLEEGFMAEFGSYGNRLRSIGLESQGSDPRYIVGQFQGACDKPSGDIPSKVSPAGVKLVQERPTYYEPDFSTATKADFAVGRMTFTRCIPGVSLFVNTSAPYAYLMGAEGVIASGVNRDDPGSDQLVDVWTLNDKKELTNVKAGFN